MKHLLIVAALVALPLTAFAGPKDDAKKHIAAATEAHQQGKFDVALKELDAAYALDPQPDLLYAIGQVHVKLGDCPAAVASYEKFLATNPPAEPSAAAKEAVTACNAQTAAQPTEPPPPPPPPEDNRWVTPQPTDAPKPFYMDPLGSTLVGVGIVSTLVGVFLYSTAISTLDDAEAANSFAEHETLVDDAHSKRTMAVVFGIGGAVAIGLGVWRYTMVRNKEKSSVAVTPTPSGGMVMWMGSF